LLPLWSDSGDDEPVLFSTYTHEAQVEETFRYSVGQLPLRPMPCG
jgi:hypothetical protein